MKTAVFSDLPILLATNIKGNIDGGMPLDKALAVPTFAPMKVNMTADMVLNFKALAPVAKQLGLNFPQSAAFPGVIGTFTLAPTVAVPETSTYAMMGLGMAGLLVVRRRRPA
ncbi:MAG: PEP-CTERM sorting domain-containing protein [Rubrivivax sp.]|nr:MAG: PEP-CTERM sorting domain-containing protein [Rubrivivax sp.]